MRAHHSPGLASSTRSCIERMSSSHLRYVGSSFERAKSFAGSKPSRVSQYMNIRRPSRKIFISVTPISRRRATTSGQTSACSFLYRAMRRGSSRRLSAIPYAGTSRPPVGGGVHRKPIQLRGVSAEDPLAVVHRQVADGLPAGVDDARVRSGDETHRPIRPEHATLGTEPLEHVLHVGRDVAHRPSLPVGLGHHPRVLYEHSRAR